MRSAFCISFSDSSTSSVARPAAIAMSFFANVEPCTTARSIRSNTLSKIHLRVSTAPTGTWPPDSDLDSSTMSGSMPQCSQARKRPVRPNPVWISSAMNKVPYLRQRSSAERRYPSSGMVTPLPWIGSTMKAAICFRGQSPFERGEIVERHFHAAGHQRTEALAEDLIAVERERAIGQPVIGMARSRRCRRGRWRRGRISATPRPSRLRNWRRTPCRDAARNAAGARPERRPVPRRPSGQGSESRCREPA